MKTIFDQCKTLLKIRLIFRDYFLLNIFGKTTLSCATLIMLLKTKEANKKYVKLLITKQRSM